MTELKTTDSQQRPRTQSNESCLCLTVLSEPLRLNSTLGQQPSPFFNQLR